MNSVHKEVWINIEERTESQIFERFGNTANLAWKQVRPNNQIGVRIQVYTELVVLFTRY